MNLLGTKSLASFLITLITVGVFAIPSTSQAAWTDIFGTSKTNNSYQNYNSYNYNSTEGVSEGDIKLTKEVKEIGVDDNYHDKIQIRSGALVEVWIEVKNTSSKYSANTVVRDEISGNSVYAKDSLRLNGQTTQPGLTSGGLRVTIPSKGKAIIIYRMYVCGNSGYPMRAYASAPGIGAATDAIIITSETFNIGYYDDTYTCMSQFQNTGSTTGSVLTGGGNPFSDWTGVNNFNTATSTTTSTSATANNPFAGWYGVNNSNTTAPTTTTTVSNSGNPFGDWYGSSTTTSTNSSANAFGDWTGVASSDNQYDMSGYTNNSQLAYADTTSSNNTVSTSEPSSSSSTYFVAPTTGVSKTAPFVFAGMLTLAFIAFRKRKLLFS